MSGFMANEALYEFIKVIKKPKKPKKKYIYISIWEF